jgi:hypothetical protein
MDKLVAYFIARNSFIRPLARNAVRVSNLAVLWEPCNHDRVVQPL